MALCSYAGKFSSSARLFTRPAFKMLTDAGGFLRVSMSIASQRDVATCAG